MIRFASPVFGFVRSIIVYRLNVAGQFRQRRLYRQFVRPGDLVFDVGAHVGGRIWAFRALRCRVVAIEPQDIFFRFLRRLYAHAEDVALESCAVGAQTGAGNMLVSHGNPTLSSLSSDWIKAAADTDGFRHVDWDGRQQVSIETLDALIARHGMPQFCKIDVEGFEYDVLRGLCHPVPALSFEFLTAQRGVAAKCIEYLDGLGPYVFNISYGEKSALVKSDWCTATDILDHLETLPPAVSSGDVYARVLPRK